MHNFMWEGTIATRMWIIDFCGVTFSVQFGLGFTTDIGFETVYLARHSDHFFQFGHLCGASKNYKPVLYMLWLFCIRVIWKERNNDFSTKGEN